jgi:hypothetical protein
MLHITQNKFCSLVLSFIPRYVVFCAGVKFDTQRTKRKQSSLVPRYEITFLHTSFHNWVQNLMPEHKTLHLGKDLNTQQVRNQAPNSWIKNQTRIQTLHLGKELNTH